jgi:hypothetical protein
MMKQRSNGGFSKVLVIVGVVAVIAAGGLGWVAYGTSNSKDMAAETSAMSQPAAQSDQAKPEPVKDLAGSFTGVAPKTGSGRVTLSQEKAMITLGEDFKVQDGPALYVGFGNDGTVDQATLFAPLKATEGKQEYQVPDTIELAKYDQVFIYCKEFSTAFSVATLQ